jgi:hypothetical protein
MKKIIALFVFMLAFGLTANAQQKGSTEATSVEQKIKQAAAKDLALMMEVIELDSEDKQSFMGLFERKHNYLMQNLSEERKTILANETKAKIEATLDADQYAKLTQSPGVMQKLIN